MFCMYCGKEIPDYAKFFVMIQKKDAGFLRFREKVLLIGWGAAVLVFLVIYAYMKSKLGLYVSYFISPDLFYYVMVGLAGIGYCALEILYYGKSVRVRTYFGSDEYLRRSIFMHNRVYPVPAVPDRT